MYKFQLLYKLFFFHATASCRGCTEIKITSIAKDQTQAAPSLRRRLKPSISTLYLLIRQDPEALQYRSAVYQNQAAKYPVSIRDCGIAGITQSFTNNLLNFTLLLWQIVVKQNYWKEVLRHAVFQGHDEKLGSSHNGNYLSLLNLIAKFDPFLQEYLNTKDGRVKVSLLTCPLESAKNWFFFFLPGGKLRKSQQLKSNKPKTSQYLQIQHQILLT